jgi:hypothetical protein
VIAKLDMPSWAHTAFIACWIGAVASWIVALPPFIGVAAELRRARKAGEADHIPQSHRGIPFAVLFGDVLPGARRYRKRLAISMIAFVSFWAAGMLVMMFFGPHHQ